MCAESSTPLPQWLPPALLPELNLSAAWLHRGDSTRLLALRARLEAGCALRVVALGGSSTAGHALPRDSEELYHAQLLRWIRAAYPGGHALLNSGTPAVGPQYMEKCLSYQLPVEPPHLVLVEYNQNLENHREALALERLLRRLLAMRSEPAVLLALLPTWKAMQRSHDATANQACA